MWKYFIALLNYRYDVRYLLLRPIDDHICKLEKWPLVSHRCCIHFIVYFETWVLFFKWCEMIKVALLCETRKSAQVFSDDSNLILRRTRNMRPKEERRIKSLHDVDWFYPVKASEIILLQLFLRIITIIQNLTYEMFILNNNICHLK